MTDIIEQAFASAFGLTADQISDSLSPPDVKGWDSLGHLRLVATLQEALGLEFEVDEIMRMENVAKIKEILAERGVQR